MNNGIGGFRGFVVGDPSRNQPLLLANRFVKPLSRSLITRPLVFKPITVSPPYAWPHAHGPRTPTKCED